MKKYIVLITVLLLHGCASIVSRSAYPILINSNPDRAEFIITNLNGVEIKHGQTPATVWLESGAGYFRRGYYTVHFSKPGFEPQIYKLASRMDGWYWGNLLNPLGMLLIDPTTGAMWCLPQRLDAELPKKPTITTHP